MSSENMFVLTSVLILTITQISYRVHDMELSEIVSEYEVKNENDFSLFCNPFKSCHILIHKFGRLTLVHLANITLIWAVAYFSAIVFAIEQEGFLITIPMILIVFYTILPLLEIKEYDQIIAGNGTKHSILYNGLTGAIIISTLYVNIYVYGEGYIWNEDVQWYLIPVGLLALAILLTFVFLKSLERDIFSCDF